MGQINSHVKKYFCFMLLQRNSHWNVCLFIICFFNSLGDWGSIPGRVIPKTQKMVLDASLLNTQHYKVWIKGKVEQSWKRSSAPPLHVGVVAIGKGEFASPSTMVPNFTLLTPHFQQNFVIFLYEYVGGYFVFFDI